MSTDVVGPAKQVCLRRAALLLWSCRHLTIQVFAFNHKHRVLPRVLQVVGEMALLESAAAAAAAPAADAEGGSGTGAGTKTTRSSGRVDDSAGGSGWSAFRWPKRGAGAADAGIPPGTRGASVRALTAVSVAVVPAAHFHAVCAAHPEVRMHAQHVREGEHHPLQQWCTLDQGAPCCSRCT